MKSLVIVRGVSGSGKTTFAERFFPKVYSADDYFMKDGEYRFDASKLKRAHNYCYSCVLGEMMKGTPEIAVANTFTREWEFKKYVDLAKDCGYTVFTVIVENRHGGENVHGVPEETVQAMKDRFEVTL